MAKEIRKKQRTRRGPSKPKFGASSDRKLSAGRDERSKNVEEQPPNLQFLKRYQGTLAEIIRGSDLVVLNAALNFLFTRLREARRQFEQEGDGGRLGRLRLSVLSGSSLSFLKSRVLNHFRHPFCGCRMRWAAWIKIPYCRSSRRRSVEDAANPAMHIWL